MIRRALIASAALAGLGAVGLALAPWTVSSRALAAAIAHQLRDAYGLDLTVAGRSTIALLPVPRLKFEDVALVAPDGAALVRGGHLRGEFRLVPLLFGRMELSDLSLDGSRIDVHLDAAGRTGWRAPYEKLLERLRGAPLATHLRRVTVTGSYLVYRDERTGGEAVVRDINLAAHWPTLESAVEVAGGLVWSGEPVELTATGLRPSALASGRATAFTLQAAAAPGRVRLTGNANGGDDPRILGRAAFETRSLAELLAWTGVKVPLGPMTRALALEGDFTFDRQGVSYPAVRLTLGGRRLDGALAVRLDGERPLVTGTLAADRADLSDLFAPLAGLWTTAGQWSSDPLDIGPLTRGGDLDLRFSAAEARVGPLRLDDMAANLLVKPGRIDAALVRAGLNGGVVKGRLGLLSGEQGLDLRAQGSFERLEAGAVLGDLGQSRWLTGLAQGHLAFEGAGETAAGIVRQGSGRGTITVRAGELTGLGLYDLLRDPGRRLATPALARGGRTPFDRAQASFTLGQGVLDIPEAGVTAPNLRAALHGNASLNDRTVALKARLDAGDNGGPAPVAVEINGPWDDPAVTPDARALLQRSGAAQPPALPAVLTRGAPAQ